MAKKYSPRQIRALKQLAEIKQNERWRKNPMLWLEERLGEDPKDFLWSLNEGYDTHEWDGTKDPLATAWNILGASYKEVSEGKLPTYKNVAVESGTGCHAYGQGILMHNGSIKKVQDIEIGDKIMGDDSKPRNVLKLHRGKELMYKIVPNKGEPYTVNASHILNLKLTGDKKIKGRSYPLTENVSVRDYLNWSSRKKHNYKQHSTGVSFRKKKLAYCPYFMGLWLGDGSTNSPAITNIDAEIVAYIYEFAQTIGARVSKRDSQGTRTPNYLITYGGGRNNLKRYLETTLVQKEKRIPKNYLTSNRKDRLKLLAGLIDSDGSRDGKGFEYSTALKGLSEDILYLCRSLGFMANSQYYENDFKGVYRINISGYCNIVPVLVPRKKTPKRIHNKNVLFTGFNVKVKEVGDYYGFELDGNNLYLMSNFVVTHNTGKTYCLARIVLWFLDCFDNSLVLTTCPSENQLKGGLWSEISMLYPKIKKLRPNSQKWQLKLAMEWNINDSMTEEEKTLARSNAWQATGFITGTSSNKESEDKARGFHRKFMLIILEECTGIPPSIITALQNTCTGNTNFIIGVGNPNNEFDALHQFSIQKDCFAIRASSLDHPNIVNQNEMFAGAITQSSINSRSDNYGESSPLWQAMVRGISPAQSTDSLIKMEWIEKCVNTENTDDPKVSSQNAVGVDVANSTDGDKASLVFGELNTIKAVFEFQCENATHLAYNLYMDSTALGIKGYCDYEVPVLDDYNINAQFVGVDSVGVGVATVNAFVDDNFRVQSLSGGQWTEVIPKEERWEAGKKILAPMYRFQNLRGQMYWELREDIRRGFINIDLGDDKVMLAQLCKELCIPKFEASNSMITIEGKENIKKRLGGKSPNVADAVVYWNWVRKGYRAENRGFAAFLGGEGLD